MKIPTKYYDQLFDFEGQWGVKSRCGLRILNQDEKVIIIVTELYQDNPGSDITNVSASLATQICDKFDIPFANLVYVECSPNMNSKLSFYDEEFFRVHFDIQEGKLVNPVWTKLSTEETIGFIK